MDLGLQKFRCQGADALKQAIHNDNGLAWTDGKGILLSPVSLFQGQVEPQEHYKLGEFDRGVKSVHWSDNIEQNLCYLCVVHDKNISLWRVDGQQPKLSFKQVRKVNIQPVPQGCLWNPGRDILGVLCPHQASLYYSHLRNKGSQILLQLERDKIRCGCWVTDGSKLVICVGTTLMVYCWSDIDKSVTQYSAVTWTVPGLIGRISSVVPVSSNRILQAAELPLESLCKQQDTFLLPDVVKPSANESVTDNTDSDVIKPSGKNVSLTQTLFNLPRNPETVIEDCCRLDCVELREDKDPTVVSGCQVKGLLTPDILLYERDLQTVVVGSNTQSLLQVYSVDQKQITKTAEIILDKQERPKGIGCFPGASSHSYQGILVLVGKTTASDSAFPSSTNEITMKSMLKFFSVKQGRNGKTPLTHTTSAPSIPLSVATNGSIDDKEHERLTYSVINFDTNLQSAQSVSNIKDNGRSNITENRSVSEVNVSGITAVKTDTKFAVSEGKTESRDGKKEPSAFEPPKRPVRKKKSLRGKQDLSRNSSNSSGSQNEQPKKLAMEYLSDSSETSPRDFMMKKQDSIGSVSSTQSMQTDKINVIQEVDSLVEKETVKRVEASKPVLKEVDINQNTAKSDSNCSEGDLHSKNGEVTTHTQKFPNQRSSSSVLKVAEIGGSNLTNGELEVERTEFTSQKQDFKSVDLGNLCADDAENRRIMEDVINKKLGLKAAANKQSVSMESLDDIDRILQAQNKRISKLQEQMNNLSRRVDESSCVLPTRYQSIGKADMVHLCFRCKDGFEIKKKFLLDNGRLKLEEVKQAFSLGSLEIQIDEDWCVTGCNIDGYIPVRFESGATVYINGNPALS